MLGGHDICKNPAYIRLFKPICADALAGHSCAALTKPQNSVQARLGWILANPADASANLAIGIRHAAPAMFGFREETLPLR
jgi:hypothetical protein